MELILEILIFGSMFLLITLLIYDVWKDMCTEQPKKKKYNIQYEINMNNEAMWVKKVIKSCKTYTQLIVAEELRYILKEKYKNKVDSKLLNRIIDNLYWDWDEMTYQVSYD